MGRRILLLLLSLCFFCGSFPVFAAKTLVRLEGLSTAQMREYGRLGYDIAKHGHDFLEVVLNSDEVKKVSKAGQKVTTIVPDLDKYVADVISKETAGAKYYTYQTMTDALKEYAQKYSKVCKLESIGKSFEKREIWALKISDNPNQNEKEPAVLVMGAHHSREWISFEVPMATLKLLLESYGKDERLTRLVNEREIWFVPMVNPDGVAYSQTKEKYWRKNRRKNSDGSYGVDPNRNYGYEWSLVGASDYPNSDTYHGTGPFSEPETQAIRDFAKREMFSDDISFHSYSELVLYPWSYTSDKQCPHHDLFAKFAGELAEFNKYSPEQSSELYPSSGDTDDFMYGELRSLSFTFELADTFIPDPDQIAVICDQNVPAVIHLIDKAGTYGLVSPTGGDAIAGLDSNTAAAALQDLAPFASDETVASRLRSLQIELAKRIVSEDHAGQTMTRDALARLGGDLPLVKAVEQTALLMRNFAVLHGDSDVTSHQRGARAPLRLAK